MYSIDTTPRPSPQRSLQRLLHIEASGSEVAIDYALVRSMGSFGEMSRVAPGGKIHERVAVFEGDIIPVIDIRGTAQTGGPLSASDFPDFLVLVLPGQPDGIQLVGVRVDRVIEILLVPAHDIQSLHASAPADFISGVVSLRTRRLPLVNMHSLLQPAAARAMHKDTPCADRRLNGEESRYVSTAWQRSGGNTALVARRESEAGIGPRRQAVRPAARNSAK